MAYFSKRFIEAVQKANLLVGGRVNASALCNVSALREFSRGETRHNKAEKY